MGKTKKRNKPILEQAGIVWKKKVMTKAEKTLLYPKGSDVFSVAIDKNPECIAEVIIMSLENINSIPPVTQEDLIVIDIPLKNHKTMVNSFPSKQDIEKQKKNLCIFHIKYAQYGDTICLPLETIENSKDYSSKPCFPESVNRAIVGMLLGA